MQTTQDPALQGETAELQPAAFSASPADLQALLNEPVCVPLTDLGVIAVRGADPVLRVTEVQPTRSAAPAVQARNHAATPTQAKP